MSVKILAICQMPMVKGRQSTVQLCFVFLQVNIFAIRHLSGDFIQSTL